MQEIICMSLSESRALPNWEGLGNDHLHQISHILWHLKPPLERDMNNSEQVAAIFKQYFAADSVYGYWQSFLVVGKMR